MTVFSLVAAANITSITDLIIKGISLPSLNFLCWSSAIGDINGDGITLRGRYDNSSAQMLEELRATLELSAIE